jgi:hypothetical protein
MTTHPLQKRLLALAAFIAALTGISTQAEALQTPPRFDGSFLQLTEAHRKWTAADWSSLLNDMKEAGLDYLIVQWSAYDRSNFAAGAEDSPGAPPSPLDRVLQAADQAKLGIYVGLVQDSDFWSRIKLDPASVEVYLQQLRLRQTELAEQLAPRLREHRSVRGWFITEEIDDMSWRDPAHREPLFRHLGLLSDRLDKLLPARKIALSGFSNAAVDPLAFGGFWGSLLKSAPAIDVVLFQDGVGVNKLRPPEVPIYLKTLSESVRSAGKELWTVVEIFQQTGGMQAGNQRFTAEPAPIERINRQMELAGPYSSSLVAFSIPEYMNRRAGAEAERLLLDYRTQRQMAVTP